ncbi:twin-arginine translocase TatA/TatE family subunit [Deinococcus kurensis]|uniref:twin-arginine translocase TatA/TatE family subunit n=1 Tax=Deinococcus kurensis TaxID=2662757 RepID=UPI0012D2BD84|nr:twin-arginine translocase TatA/TatE family subunit [Deinococcus kurensis]
MPNIGPAELLVVLLVALVVFGPRKLPELGKSLGNGLREFRKSTQGLRDDLNVTAPAQPAATVAPAVVAAPAVTAQAMAAQPIAAQLAPVQAAAIQPAPAQDVAAPRS